MLVASSCCHSTSNSSNSSERPFSGVTSICRVTARHSGERRCTVSAVRTIWPALAWLVMRFAVCTDAPKMSRFSSTTEPKWQPMRIATCWPCICSVGWTPMSCCISAAAFTASSAVGKMARISSPMVLMTLPRLRSVAPRMMSTQIPIMSRAARSPSTS